MKKLVLAFVVIVGAIWFVPNGPANAEVDETYCAIPPFIARQGPPLVSIVLGRDHKLYYEAYNDASDLNEDGTLDVGYDHNIEYYGYFDSYKCYTYDGTNERFNPSSVSTDMYCSGASEWSGNFLNWLSMSRADVLRKVLYGGHRSTDTSTNTVLEGIYIPQDAHSWGKEYSGSDTDQLTPFSDPDAGNRHLFCVTSIAANQPHRIRVTQNVSDRIWEWASTERAVCSGDETPAGYRHWGDGTAHDYSITDYMLRVKVCDTALGIDNLEENCRLYSDGTTDVYKPAGILQKYGEGDGQNKVCSKTFKSCSATDPCGAEDGDCINLAKIYFALITGSYTKNKSGGVLRRVMGDITDELDPDTGVFDLTENTTKGNIILTLEELTTINFDYSDFAYDNCGWITERPMNEGECEMWGNPIAEMMYESLRYFADTGSATSDFDQSSPDAGLDLPTPSSWTQPFQIYPLCSKPSMLVISDINPSFDSDQVPGTYTEFGSFSGDLAGLNVSDILTNDIGPEELPSGPIFIGQNGATTDYICSSKNVSDMAQIRGLCPEEPTKQGSYYAAAVAQYGKTDFYDNTGKPDVNTYSVALASPIPDINIPVGSNTVTLVPVGKSVSGCYNVYESCASECPSSYYENTGLRRGLRITGCSGDSYCPSNQIVDFYVESLTSTSGSFRINFEDVEQGADHDMDAIVNYTYTVSGDTVTISIDSSEYAAGCIDQALGFFISGTTEDGLYLPVKDDDVPNVADSETPAVVAGMPKTWSKVFTVGATTTATLLKDPLWYAAKYGGFNDINNSGDPDITEEWDKDGDTVPDNYFLVHNPLKLEEQLNAALGEILKRISSGTAVSVLSTSAGGEGSLFQAYFNPSVFSVFDGQVHEATWVGYLNALWVDQYGNLREDVGGAGGTPNQHLVLTEDPIIQFELDTDGDTIVEKYADADGDGHADDPNNPIGSYPLSELQAIWEGGAILAERDLGAQPRQISTFINEDGAGYVPTGTDEWSINNFTTAKLAELTPLLDASNPTDIINFIRGGTFSNCRPRQIGANDWRLGDIVYSTPTVVSRPMENYHLIYGDTSYLEFVRQHKNRKTMIYVGGNDGMLHAFSAGTYHEGDDTSTNGVTEQGWYDGDCGAEIWAYIPYNLLPQLKWLADPGYCHVYYVDLKAKVVDAKIFTADENYHINGWGTVLIGAMRLGGKEITVDSQPFRSAYFAIDITNPEAPNLMWEFTDSDLGFTTSYPAVFKVGTAWYVIFGSGPSTLEGEGSSTTGYVYIRNLEDGSEVRKIPVSLGNPGFMASPITIDLGLDYEVDVAYIGASYYDSTDARWEGKIIRVDINEDTNTAAWTTSPFITIDQPITVAPVASLDPFSRLWLYWGTGRFYSTQDKSNADVQRLYGVWDPGTTVDPADLNNVTDIKVYEMGYMDTDGTPGEDTTFPLYLASKRGEYVAETNRKYGWFLNMTSPLALDGERAIHSPTVLGDIVLFPTYKPEEDICAFGGNSYLYALYYETGTAYEESVIGTTNTDFVTIDEQDYDMILKRRLLGAGMPTSVVIHAGQQEGVKGMIQLGTGVVEVVDINPAASPQNKTIFWRERSD